MVPQSRQDRNYIVADVLALKQAVAIQLPNVDQTVLKQQAGTAQCVFHPHWRFTHVEQNLQRELSEQPMHT